MLQRVLSLSRNGLCFHLQVSASCCQCPCDVKASKTNAKRPPLMQGLLAEPVLGHLQRIPLAFNLIATSPCYLINLEVFVSSLYLELEHSVI
jgi:hypothetical protein